MGGSLPGAALTEEGMGLSYQAFCIAQRGLTPWPFGAMEEAEGEEGGEGAEPDGTAPAPQQDTQQPGPGGSTQQQQQQHSRDK